MITKYRIKFGGLLENQQKLVKRIGIPWGIWVSENLHISEETSRKYQKVYKRLDSHSWVELVGLEKGIILIDATDKRKGADRIGDFMREYGIEYNAEKPKTVKQFSQEVDAALAMELLKKSESERVEYEKVKKVYSLGKKLDDSTLSSLAELERDGNDPNKRLDRIIRGEPLEGIKNNKGKYVTSFKEIAKELKDALQDLMEYEEEFDLIELADLDNLKDTIKEYEKFINGKK